jgi:hypothetical protein
LPHLRRKVLHGLDVVHRTLSLFRRHFVELTQTSEQPLLGFRGQPAKPWFALHGLFLLLRRQVLMPLKPRAQMRLLVIFKAGMPTRLLPRVSEAGNSSQRQYQQQHGEDTTSELPAEGCRLDLVLPCHDGAL